MIEALVSKNNPLLIATKDTEPRTSRDRFIHVITGFPDRIVLILFWVSLVVSLTIALGVFYPLLVIPVCIALIVATWRYSPHTDKVSNNFFYGSLIAIIFCLLWVAINIPFASRYIFVSRDPGFLTLMGFWLRNNPTATIPLTINAAALPQFISNGSGFAIAEGGNYLYAQGAKLLPGLLAVLGWAGGDQAIMAGNLVIGAIGLLSVYGFARRILGPILALVPMMVLAISIPYLVFARGAYSEIVTIPLAFGGLTLAWDAMSRRNESLFLIAGAMIGATSLARIDGPAQVIGLAAACGLAAAFASKSQDRKFMIRASVLGITGAIITLYLGWLDLWLNSPVYLSHLGNALNLLYLALVAIIAFSVIINLPNIRKRFPDFLHFNNSRIALICAFGILAILIFFASRPLWYIQRGVFPATGAEVARLMGLEGTYPPDSTRTFGEQTITWLAWYYGWPVIGLSFLGLTFIAWRAIKRKDARYLTFLAVTLAPSLLFLWNPSITPDQVWAVRRFISITIPAFLIAATVVLSSIWNALAAKIFHDGNRIRLANFEESLSGIFLIGLVTLMFLYPLTTWSGNIRSIEFGGAYQIVAQQCDLIEDRPVVFRGWGAVHPAIQIICDTETLRWSDWPNAIPITPDALVEAGEALGQMPVVISNSPSFVPWIGDEVPEPRITEGMTRLNQTITRRLSGYFTEGSDWWVGLACADGYVDPEMLCLGDLP